LTIGKNNGQIGWERQNSCNKIHAATKISPFKANYGQDLRMGFEGRRKGKYKVAGKFVERMKRIQKEAKMALEKAQEEMKKFADKK